MGSSRFVFRLLARQVHLVGLSRDDQLDNCGGTAVETVLTEYVQHWRSLNKEVP